MEKIGIVGSGAMGSGIAQVAAMAGHEVFLFDNQRSALDVSRSKQKKVFDRLVEKGKITAEQSEEFFGNIHYRETLHDFSKTNLVIEAVVEKIEVKQEVFQKLEKLVPNDTILASNTSSLSIASVASSCNLSGRVIGIHFFNPAPLMPLVEIIPAVQTDSEIVAQSRSLIDGWGKVTVLAKDTPGFIVNRVARPFYGEALRIYEEGLADFVTIDWIMREKGGFRMGPFELMDFIGNDINYTVTETVFRSFFYDPRYRPSFTQKRMSEAGFLGRKSGRGYYDYYENAQKPVPAKAMDKVDEILERILVMLFNEAADALFWGVASRDDIDLAMTKGVNYPKGLLKWADEFGIAQCVSRLDDLYDRYREDRYRCSPLLREMAAKATTFY